MQIPTPFVFFKVKRYHHSVNHSLFKKSHEFHNKNLKKKYRATQAKSLDQSRDQ